MTSEINVPEDNGTRKANTMKLTILGASGATGTYLTSQALAAGHEVTAVVRDPARLAVPAHPRLRTVIADVMDPASIAPAIEAADPLTPPRRPAPLIATPGGRPGHRPPPHSHRQLRTEPGRPVRARMTWSDSRQTTPGGGPPTRRQVRWLMPSQRKRSSRAARTCRARTPQTRTAAPEGVRGP